MLSTVGNGSTMIVTLTLTSSSMFLLLPTGRSGMYFSGSGMYFSFVFAPTRSVGCYINVEVMEGCQGLLLGRGGVWRQFCLVGSTCFIVFFAFCSYFQLLFSLLWTSGGWGGHPAGGICCSGFPLLLRSSLFLLSGWSPMVFGRLQNRFEGSS